MEIILHEFSKKYGYRLKKLRVELFDYHIGLDQNLLPQDGVVNYFGKILNAEEADKFFNILMNKSAWQNDEVLMFGKKIITSRKIAWYADNEMDYTYSKIKKTASVWYPELLILKNKVENLTGHQFNSCLLNLYHNGKESMGFHSDAEADLVQEGAIASLSLGAERRFIFKHKISKEKVECILQNGSLIVMKGQTQLNWLHSLPPSAKIFTPRINITFRTRNAH